MPLRAMRGGSAGHSVLTSEAQLPFRIAPFVCGDPHGHGGRRAMPGPVLKNSIFMRSIVGVTGPVG